MSNEQFLRTEMLLGEAAMEKLAAAHVAVFGLGGVGSWCAEALARSGVGALTLVDNDQVGMTNLNRQSQALHSTLGLDKTEALARRIRDINPNCSLHLIPEKYEAATRESFFAVSYDYIVDAIDLVSCKLDLIETSLQRGIPIISSMGTGNKLDPSQFRVTDISKTEGCPLARIIRKELKARNIRHHKVVFSPELPAQTDQKEAPPPGRRSVPASAPWVPPVAGFLLAGAVIQDLIKE
ncbi:tRNA threonylcarbamoyladenosine dehydratase [Evtepia sp.]|uniref:tRNA threonylcarbamoyladenosine dehydratase n=1 Tax=Evtepia sp. TaxID=2773933 RepID=UPI003F157586